MKKIIALVLCLVMAMFLVACGGNETTDKASDSAIQTTTTTEESQEPNEKVEDAKPEESKEPEEVADNNGTIALSDGLVNVNVTIDGVPDEWKIGVGEEVASIQDDAYIGTTYKDTNAVVSGYFFFQGVEVSEEDYNKLLTYFDANEYIDCSKTELPYGYETVYTCEWGNCQVRYNKEETSMHVSWRTFENT